MQTVQANDGRTIAFDEWGDPAGRLVFALHGTPGTRLQRHPWDDRLADIGVRLVTYDRPGYGHSDRQAGRRVVDCVGDVAAIADHLGVDRFAVTGGSGGGPHALAVAARLPDRVVRAQCVVGVAPYSASDLDWFAGMDPENVKEFGWALAGEEVLRPELAREAQAMLARVSADPSNLLGDFDIPEADLAVLADPSIQRIIQESTPEIVVQGVDGWVDDDLAFTKTWGFDLAEIRVPVQIRYGASDVLVPAAHGAWLARHVPGAEEIVDESGHLVGPEDTLEQLRELIKPDCAG